MSVLNGLRPTAFRGGADSVVAAAESVVGCFVTERDGGVYARDVLPVLYLYFVVGLLGAAMTSYDLIEVRPRDQTFVLELQGEHDLLTKAELAVLLERLIDETSTSWST